MSLEGWLAFTLAVLEDTLPSDVLSHYATWVAADPAREGRLEALIEETRDTFRAAVALNPANEVDTNPDTVPTLGFRHAVNTVMVNLLIATAGELGPETYSLLTRAEIWLRMVQRGEIAFGGAITAGTPSYEPAIRSRSVL